MAEGMVKTRVLELESSWLLVTFQGEKPPLPSRPYWLRRSLADWRREHPERRVYRTQAVQHGGQLVGLMAWTDEPPHERVPYRVHQAVKSPPEHVEALVEHAYGIYFQDTSGQDLAVVNRAGVAVVFDRQAAHVVPFELVPVDDPVRAEYAAWRTSSTSNYFAVRLRR